MCVVAGEKRKPSEPLPHEENKRPRVVGDIPMDLINEVMSTIADPAAIPEVSSRSPFCHWLSVRDTASQCSRPGLKSDVACLKLFVVSLRIERRIGMLIVVTKTKSDHRRRQRGRRCLLKRLAWMLP